MKEGTKAKTVMIADDEPAIVSLLMATLGDDERYRVITARDGKEALEIATREKPDLIFLDILMPKMDGYEVCRRLKADRANARMKIVMLTALAREDERRQALSAGADDYFTKPFSPTALLEKVEEILDQAA